MENGAHRHFTHQRIIKVVGLINRRWGKLREDYERLSAQAGSRYTEMAPLVRYLERGMLEVGTIDKQVRSVTQDYERLTTSTEDVKDRQRKVEKVANQCNLG